MLTKFAKRFYWKPIAKRYENQITCFFTSEHETWRKSHVNAYVTFINQNALKTWSTSSVNNVIDNLTKTYSKPNHVFQDLWFRTDENFMWTFTRHGWGRHLENVLTKFPKQFSLETSCKHNQAQITCIMNAKPGENLMWTFIWHVLNKCSLKTYSASSAKVFHRKRPQNTKPSSTRTSP